MTSRMSRTLILTTLLLGLARVAAAADPATITIAIHDHRFEPAEVHVQAGQPAILVIDNQDATAEEFESDALKVEKVVPAGKSVTVRLRALKPGRYTFVGEYHQKTAQGVVVAE